MTSHSEGTNPAKTAARGFISLVFWMAAIVGVFFGCGVATALAGPVGLFIFLIAVSYVAGRRVLRSKPAAPVAPAPPPLAQAPQPQPVVEAAPPLPSPTPTVLHIAQQTRERAPAPAANEWETTRE